MRVADGGGGGGVGDADDDVRLDWRLAGQLAAHVHAHRGEGLTANDAVRAGEVDVLEDAECVALLLDRLDCVEARLVDDHRLAGLDLTDEFGTEVVEGAGLRGADPAAPVQLPA